MTMIGKRLVTYGFIVILVFAMMSFIMPVGAVIDPSDPASIPKYVTPLLIPPEMPKTSDNGVDYEIAVQQFEQQILPAGFPSTTVWSYGSLTDLGTFHYPAYTIEARYGETTKVKWINNLVDESGNYLPHLLPVDQTLHWANPPGGLLGRDMHSDNASPYTGPVPMITHVHGAHTYQESDGYPEAWYLPAANNIPAGYAKTGTYYDIFEETATFGDEWGPGSAVFEYPNDQRATTLWYHDHTLGMTRTNVYAGPAGFYLIRGGPDDVDLGFNRPGLNLGEGEDPGDIITDIPLVIQDRSFNSDGSLFYPDTREFFDGFTGPYLPDPSSDVSPIWNPEFFGNTTVVNGNTWPFLEVEQRQYRFRILNGAQSRFLILQMNNSMNFTQIGTEGGFLPWPVELAQLLIGPAERADVILNFSSFDVGTEIIMENIGPDDPFGGGEPGVDFDPADPDTTGQVMLFRVIAATDPDPSTPADEIDLPTFPVLGSEDNVRQVSLNEEMSVIWEGPRAALLGTVDLTIPTVPLGVPLMWSDPITESVNIGDTEIWEIYDFTADAHPIHIHQVQFQVVNREIFDPDVGTPGETRDPESWESGYKDTVIVYPGQLTRVKAKFDLPGLFVWHCHILEHEDNEMMRPYGVVLNLTVCKENTTNVPLSGWNFTIDDVTQTTGGNGCTVFELLPGTYTVTETLKEGWTNITPLSQEVELTEAASITFMNALNSSINVCKVNITKEGTEVGSLSGWNFTLTGKGKELTQTTDGTGCTNFTNLVNGTYTIEEDFQDDLWINVTPTTTEVILPEGTDNTTTFKNRYMDVWCGKEVSFWKTEILKYEKENPKQSRKVCDEFFDEVEPTSLDGYSEWMDVYDDLSWGGRNNCQQKSDAQYLALQLSQEYYDDGLKFRIDTSLMSSDDPCKKILKNDACGGKTQCSVESIFESWPSNCKKAFEIGQCVNSYTYGCSAYPGNYCSDDGLSVVNPFSTPPTYETIPPANIIIK